MMSVSEEILGQRRDGVALQITQGIRYQNCTSQLREAIDRIITLQDQLVQITPRESIVRRGDVRAGLRLVDEAANEYVVVPYHYEDPNVNTGRKVVECGSGPEHIMFDLHANPNWAWHAAGNAAACAVVLEQRERQVIDGA